MTDWYRIRPISEGEFDTFEAVTDHAFVLPPPSAEHRARDLARLEFDRCIAAFDGARQVGTATAFSFRMAVPGGLVPTAGVSWVSVLPTYRRCGYALYTGDNRWEDEDSLHDCTLTVSELVATDPAASAALWGDLLCRDLVTEVRARRRPADDPLLPVGRLPPGPRASDRRAVDARGRRARRAVRPPVLLSRRHGDRGQ